MSDKLQPSSDPRATAIAVAYHIYPYGPPQGSKPQDWAHQQAKIIAELSQLILAATDPQLMTAVRQKGEVIP